MMDRVDNLYRGAPSDAADELEERADLIEVRLALINALRRIDRLEAEVAALTSSERS